MSTLHSCASAPPYDQVEDLVQDIFLSARKNLGRLRGAGSRVVGHGDCTPQIEDYHRQRLRAPESIDDPEHVVDVPARATAGIETRINSHTFCATGITEYLRSGRQAEIDTQEEAHTLRIALIERIRELPGIINVGITGRPLMRGSGVKATYAPTGERAALGDEFSASLNIVTPEYFETMGIGLLAGRNLEPSDSSATPKRVVVSEAFARHFFGSEDPLGKTFGNALDSPAKPDFEIIGVVANAKYRSMREPAPPTDCQFMYRDDMLNFYVRTQSGPESVISRCVRSWPSSTRGFRFLKFTR